MAHIPVLLNEILEYLDPQFGDVVIDATFNQGGHSREILKRVGEKGKVIGIDQDESAIEKAKDGIDKEHDNLILINGNFRNLDELIAPLNIKEIDGALFDLGLSSIQLDESGRGFTFQKDEPLLMTFKEQANEDDLTARDMVNSWEEKELANVIYEYGEERFSRRIAKAIVERRKKEKIETTFQLVDIIRSSVPMSYRNNRGVNCCTRTFQALRIAVNDELIAEKEGLSKAWSMLSSGGRLAVISFHSLEDRIAKVYFKELAKTGEGVILTKKPVVPSEDEMKDNPRARSSKLRVIEKL